MAEKAEKKVKIKLPIDRVNREQSVFISVNDRTFQIQRGVEVEVPECVAEVLEHKYDMESETDKFLNSVMK